MSNFIPITRTRKINYNPKKYIRLHRAEYAHSIVKKKSFTENSYYPDSKELIKKLAKFYKVKDGNITLGLGAESLIKDLILLHYLKNKKRISLSSQPNFFMYELYLSIFNYKKNYFDINPIKKEIDEKLIINKLKKDNINLLILVNPSHPFEKFWKLKEIKKILKFCKKKKITLIFDEVYQGLGSPSYLNLIKKFDNFIILKSLSKTFGLPGIRVGYAIASKKTNREISTLKLSHELSQNSISKSIKFLNKYSSFSKKVVKNIKKARRFATVEFKKRNLRVFGKYGNSVTVYFDNLRLLKKIGKFLYKNSIIVNYKYPRPYENYLNITTTNISNLKIFFKFFDKIK